MGKRKIIILCIIIIIFSPISIYYLDTKKCNEDIIYYKEVLGKGESNNMEDFIIYYDILDDDIIKKLSKYSVVIIEPRVATKDQVLQLKSSGSKVFGYISIVEQNENNYEFVSLRDSWFYKPNGSKITVEKWQSWYMDIRKKGYQYFLLEQIYLHIVIKELDGVLLDTVGDIDDLDWDIDDKISMRKEYTKFLRKINKNYKDLEIVQNWGFYTAKNYSYKLIDGLMWEGFSFELLDNDEWSRNRYEEIKNMDIDFYMVSPSKQEKTVDLGNNKTYIYIRDKDIYDDF